ncbi:hypothetical protein TNIN_374311 [Trichonephila inaurata madagascariensis]|uniref:Pre-C2HC domain-containing protein n=1 Tax=Trichonephila inaurata madagascariensis TaxID=2747483 RepID=A0A8X7C079_9ARAC|nr:hypothetical protein TNIN_374311 [Trichonephila inaurata madagascariensis]
MMRFSENYNLILQDLQRTHPTAEKQYLGEYIKIMAETIEPRREITNILTDKKIQFLVIQPIDNRPLKLVIKGLPVSTTIEEIKNDLINQGIKVERVAQLGQSHLTGECPIKEKIADPWCINCGEHDHFASQSKCPKFPKPKPKKRRNNKKQKSKSYC